MKREHFDAFPKKKERQKEKCTTINSDFFYPVQNEIIFFELLTRMHKFF
jgi:hypothetical protein